MRRYRGLGAAVRVDSWGMSSEQLPLQALAELLEKAVGDGVLTNREALQMRDRMTLDDSGACTWPKEMDRQLGKLFMMEVVPANHLPL